MQKQKLVVTIRVELEMDFISDGLKAIEDIATDHGTYEIVTMTLEDSAKDQE